MKRKEIFRFICEQLSAFKLRVLIIFISILFITGIGVVTPLFGQKLFDEGILRGDFQRILYYTAMIAGLFFTEQILSFLQFTQYEWINRSIPYRLLERAFRHSLDLKMSYYQDNSFYKVINNTFADINHISQVTNADLIQTLMGVFKIAGGMIGLAVINWKMMLMTVCIIPVSLLISHLFSAQKRKHFQKLMGAGEAFSMWLSETLSGVEFVKLWNLKKQKYREFEKYQQSVVRQNSKIEYLDHANRMIDACVSFVLNYGLILTGALFIMKGSLTVGGLYAFLSYSSLIIQPAQMIAEIAGRLSGSMPSFERYLEYFRNETEDLETKDKCKVSEIVPLERITFEKVDFGYTEKKQILKQVSFTVHRGEKAAFVGLNGSGKSTILSLLLRLFEPQHGRILLGDMDISCIELEEYRGLFGVMTQHAYLMNDSIRNNIDIYGEMTDEQIGQAAEVVTLNEYLSSLPEGLSTNVGYNGSKVSGGERQKIALARTLGKTCRILVMDEASSNFDLKAEEAFQEYIRDSKRYDFVFVVTHRLEMVQDMDRIFVMEEGEIVESGSYQELTGRGIDIRALLLREEKAAWES